MVKGEVIMQLETPEKNITNYVDSHIKTIINDTVNMTVLKLKMAGLMKDSRKKVSFSQTVQFCY